MSESKEEIREHSFDGIQEYDNPMPAWWKRIFFGTFMFSVAYFIYFQCGPGPSVAQEYAAEVEEAHKLESERLMKEGSVSEELLAGLGKDPGMVSEGQAKYMATCVPCHGVTAGGGIGPNLTDGYWIHGRGTLMDIYRTVNEGVLDKGMPAWGKQMSEKQVRQVVAFVATLRNTNVAGGKAPQGEKVQ